MAEKPILTATILVLDDETTGCRLTFRGGLPFAEGKKAVERALIALQAEMTNSGACPAGRKSQKEIRT